MFKTKKELTFINKILTDLQLENEHQRKLFNGLTKRLEDLEKQLKEMRPIFEQTVAMLQFLSGNPAKIEPSNKEKDILQAFGGDWL